MSDRGFHSVLEALKACRKPFLVAVGYYLGAKAAFLVGTLSDGIFAPFWPPNIILFWALLLAPKRHWLLYIAATFPAHVLVETAVGMPASQYMVAFGTNCLVAILNAIGVRRFLKEAPWFGTLVNASIYIVITAGVGPAVSAFGGAFVQVLGEGGFADYWTFWGSWYLSNALGSVAIGPVFLIWFDKYPDLAAMSSRRKTEAIVLAASLIVVCGTAFHARAGTIESGFLPALLYSPLPLILWAAVRFGEQGASGAILVVTVVSVAQNLHETLFVARNAEHDVVALQLFLIGIAVPVFLLGAAIDELRRTNQATRDLAGALLRVQDDERRRIARELHDSTGQNLVVAGLLAGRIQGMSPRSCGPLIDELMEILQRSVMEIRTVSYLLHPPLLDGGGLNLALRSFLDGFSRRTGLSVDLDLNPDLARLSPAVELALFRVTQEALTNVWRHSGSSSARVRLAQQVMDNGSQVTLTIEDSGKGIPSAVRWSVMSNVKSKRYIPSGLGLAGMRERLHQIGGQLEIDSAIGKTVIRAIVKLNEVPADVRESSHQQGA